MVASSKNVISLPAVRAGRRLPLSLEMDFTAPDESWPVGRKLWFSVLVSMLLWAVIAGALWFV